MPPSLRAFAACLIIAGAAACSGAQAPNSQTEPQPASPRATAPTPQGPVSGYVLLHHATLKHSTAQAARDAEAQPATPQDLRLDSLRPLFAHRVLEDLGDVVLVETVAPDITVSEHHCHMGSYRAAERAVVRGYVAKAALVPVTAEPVTAGTETDGFQLRPGLPVTQEAGGRWFAHGMGFSFPLPKAPKRALSYTPNATPFAYTNPTTSSRYSNHIPTKPFLEYDTELRTSVHTFQTEPVWSNHFDAVFSRARHAERNSDATMTVQTQQPPDATGRIRVTVAEPCAQVTGTVPADGIDASPPGVGGIGGKPRDPHRPVALGTGYTAKAGTPLVWASTGQPAGSLVRDTGMTYNAKGVCFPSQQRVKDDEVCVQAQHQVRNCERACYDDGLCAPSPDNMACVALDDASCAKSAACRDEGRCTQRGGACVATAAGCKASNTCTEFGRCAARDGACVATSDAMCKTAEVCTAHKACVARDGVCTRAIPCAKTKACKEEGLCAEDSQHRCVIESAEACRASSKCASEGLCGFPDPTPELDTRHRYMCGATEDAMCQASQDCKRHGRCVRKPGRLLCYVGDDAHCRASSNCATKGLCTRYEEDSDNGFGMGSSQMRAYCGAGPGDCTSSRWCKRHGYCTRKRANGAPTPPKPKPKPKPKPANTDGKVGISAQLGAGLLGSPSGAIFGSSGFSTGPAGWYCHP